MVSSKCCAVVSPSPLRFFAALIPPWAHTEWERLTGTMENRSTVPPASAILMTAASPARPPPTTMILGDAMNYVPFDNSFKLPAPTRRLGLSQVRSAAGIGRSNESRHGDIFGRVLVVR